MNLPFTTVQSIYTDADPFEYNEKKNMIRPNVLSHRVCFCLEKVPKEFCTHAIIGIGPVL